MLMILKKNPAQHRNGPYPGLNMAELQVHSWDNPLSMPQDKQCDNGRPDDDEDT